MGQVGSSELAGPGQAWFFWNGHGPGQAGPDWRRAGMCKKWVLADLFFTFHCYCCVWEM